MDAPCQLVHGDLGGNVLFDDRLPPAVIDFSPYWRPPGWASAVVVADALVYKGASLGDIQSFVDPQLLVRALIFRAVTDRLAAPGPTDDRYLEAAKLAVRLAGST